MIRHPARNYIHYWLSKKKTVGQILVGLEDLSMPLPTSERELERFARSIVETKDLMLFPRGFDPFAEEWNQQTADFLARWRISDVWRKDPFISSALDVLDEPNIRRMIEAMLLGPISPMSIAHRVRTRFGFDEQVINVRVIKSYAHYFWDVASMNQGQWRDVLFTWMPDTYIADYLGALTAPRSHAGAALTLALVDRSAESLDPVSQYTAFRDHGFSMFMEHALMAKPNLQRTQAALYAFQLVRMADEELTKHRGGSADLLEEFKRIETMYDAAQIRTAKDLPKLAGPTVIDVEEVHE